MLRWAIQSNLVNAADVEKLLAACRQHGQPAVTFETIPFSNQPPALDSGQPTVFYGSTSCMSNIWQVGKWSPGVFFDPQRFSFSEWGQAYGRHCLNGEARQTTLAALAAESYGMDRLFFLRPIHDDKAFAGEVMAFGEIQKWVGELEQTMLSPDTEILVAEPVGISHEWRLFMVDGKVSTGSHYRTRQRLDVYPGVPAEVAAFAQGLARLWQPAPVFVLDVASSANQLYLVEINCFNSAGFYASEVAKLVGDVSRYVDGY
ncbi:MAG: ATP-grasp domain-containing protein [Candidatus Eremiobacteraeota bacterium]|nr:ATP-grasp domain-containing protein [Candidatus Eremiobacteraeota bacterium]MCW5871271.1 ATP-grasp domain-containing protein [Candidatus Eremiobacteraeota bacterium]